MFHQLGANSKPSHFPEKFSNQIYFSGNVGFSYYEYESVYSIKYVLDGWECYDIGHQAERVPSGKFLLVNNRTFTKMLPAQGKKGMSVFIDPNLLKDVYSVLNSGQEKSLDLPILGNKEIVLKEGQYDRDGSPLDLLLLNISKRIEAMISGEKEIVALDLFYKLGEALIGHQARDIRQIHSLDYVKVSTRKELYKRLLRAKDFISSKTSSKIFLEDISKAALMSPYHLHRNFSMAFGVSPLRFHSDLRIKKAMEYLEKSPESILDISVKLGFSDQASFSKAFKRACGQTPGSFRKSKIRQ